MIQWSSELRIQHDVTILFGNESSLHGFPTGTYISLYLPLLVEIVDLAHCADFGCIFVDDVHVVSEGADSLAW